MKRKLLALLLALVMVLALMPVAFTPSSVAVAEEVETYALDHVQGGAILHCFNWSYKAIIDNMADILKVYARMVSSADKGAVRFLD